MPTYEYVALERGGKESRGTITAESPGAARRQLRNRHLHATKLRPVSELTRAGTGLRNFFRGKRRRQTLEFTRQLATMVEADVQLTESLAVLISQTHHQKIGPVLQSIRDQVLAGEAFADSLKQYPNYFDQIYVSMVRVGEVTGNLGKSLTLLTEYISKRQRIESKLKSAMIYPSILVTVCVGVTLILMTAVVPKLTKMITETGREVPAITQALMSVSNFLLNYWYIGLIVVLGVGYAFRRVLRTPRGRQAYDRFLLRIPALGDLIQQSIVARFTSTLAALIRSGLPMAESLQVVADVVGNSVLAQAVRLARERIIAGADVATPLRDSKIVSPAVAHMIAVGERSGELESMLVTIATGIEETTDTTIERISAIIEPAIIVVMALVVGVIVVATLLPMMQAADMSNI